MKTWEVDMLIYLQRLSRLLEVRWQARWRSVAGWSWDETVRKVIDGGLKMGPAAGKDVLVGGVKQVVFSRGSHNKQNTGNSTNQIKVGISETIEGIYEKLFFLGFLIPEGKWVGQINQLFRKREQSRNGATLPSLLGLLHQLAYVCVCGWVVGWVSV